MATNINTILNWFKTDLIPTQEQFWATFLSFWHKDDEIPQSAISNLIDTLNAKVERTQFDAHKTASDAHSELFAKVRIVPIGDFIIIKRGIATPDTLEPTDLVMGIVEGIWIFAIYNGGNKMLLENYSILNSQEF